MSKSILRIFISIFNSLDTDLILLATNSFITYSKQNHEQLIDAEFKNILSELIDKFYGEATRESPSLIDKNKSRLSGLKALQSLCFTNYFSDITEYDPTINRVIVAILSNLTTDNQKVDFSNRSFKIHV
jgi:hypothetical protein